MNRSVWIIIVVALLFRILLIFATPLYDQPALIPYFNDEPAHYNYVSYLAKYGRLPVQTSSSQDGFDEYKFEYYQAPLYYLLVSPFKAIGEKLTPSWEHIWVRLVSVLFSLAGLIVLFRTVQSFCEKRRAAIYLLLLAAFAGIPLRFGALVTNDSLLFLIACLYFSLILQVMNSKCDKRLLSMGILTVAAGLWTKVSFIVMVPVLPLVLWKKPTCSRPKATAALILPLMVILPWYFRNYLLYQRFIPIEVGFGGVDPVTPQTALWRIFYTADYFVRSFVFPYDQLWGGFLDHPTYIFVATLMILLVIFGLKKLRNDQLEWFWVFMLAIGLNLGGYLLLNVSRFQAEARLLIPALPFILYLFAAGIEKMMGERQKSAYVLLALWIVLPWVSGLAGKLIM
ncbi:hypothetical protein CEE37_11740 [candidate division LCP-89 bacterium B3_LCP]|uniref:Glycosyltransferase RgtA/B/C/D-like domain-containing protein n=1 Tax=candidate division LCP-89 bacterium B3_LCP TaxID=2012998 RepID=A0A532UVW6_UNCL8|nr:MAG: hypothetical protein CEE37_11740 [candidate division LCP-89 bacterium B3_LCP]